MQISMSVILVTTTVMRMQTVLIVKEASTAVAGMDTLEMEPPAVRFILLGKGKGKGVDFTSKPFQSQAGLPRGGGVKKHFTWEATGGMRTCDFWSAAKCFNRLATSSFQ